MGERRRYEGRFKAQVAFQVSKWKKRALEGLVKLFSDGKERREKDQQQLIDKLYRQIGKLKVELDWMKKKSGLVP